MGGDSGPESTQVQGRGVTWEGLAWQQGSGAPGGCVSHLSGEEEAQETEWPHGGGVGGRGGQQRLQLVLYFRTLIITIK